MFQMWKAPHLIKGGLTYLPVMNYWRQRRAATGGSDSARYCYSVWLRHLSILAKNGFHISGAHVGELGPGDSIGTGIAALISGAETYVGLDVVPFSAKANLTVIFDELVASYRQHEDIPNDKEFPRIRPKLDSYAFPGHLIDCENLAKLGEADKAQIAPDISTGTRISYRAPWTSPEVIAERDLWI